MRRECSTQSRRGAETAKKVRLGDVATYINGYAFKPTEWSDAGKPIIRIQDLTGNSYQMNRFAGKVPEKYDVVRGDMLISWSASLGVYVWDREDALLNQHIFKVVFDKGDIEKRYFFHQVGLILKRAASEAHGCTMKHLTKPVFDELPFTLFPRPDQKRIAAVLDKICELKKNAETRLEKLDLLVKSRFVEMFGGWLNVDSNKIKLGDLVEIERGGSPRPIDKYITDSEDGVNWIKIGDTVPGEIYIRKAKERILKSGTSKSRRVDPGDFLLSNSMSFGRPYITLIEGYIHDGWLVIRDSSNKFDKLFLHQLLSSKFVFNQFEQLASGSTVRNLNKDLVSKVEVPLPPLDLQREFAAFVEKVDKLRVNVREAVAKMDMLYRSKLQEYFG